MAISGPTRYDLEKTNKKRSAMKMSTFHIVFCIHGLLSVCLSVGLSVCLSLWKLQVFISSFVFIFGNVEKGPINQLKKVNTS